jgi:hypothetical protein
MHDNVRICGGDINANEMPEWVTLLDHHITYNRNRARVDAYDRIEKTLKRYEREEDRREKK